LGSHVVRQGWDIIPHPKTQFDPSIQRPHHPKRGDKMDKVKRKVEVDGTTIAPSELDWRTYRKKPIVITATRMQVGFRVETLEGWMIGQAGDWLIEGIIGELYPCRDSVFRATYEEVDEIPVFTLEAKIEDGIPYGRLGYTLLKHLRKQR